jgi:internalin A
VLFGKLTSLQTLDLSDNKLTSLPVGIRELRQLTHLFLHENPALGLPLEVLGPDTNKMLGPEKKKPADPAAILDYYFRIHPPDREGRGVGQVLRELKVVLVGRGEVGKTSLIEVLKGGSFIEGTKKTEGIAITRWTLMLPDGEATALVWDFGGQEIMHGTHQFFLTRRSLLSGGDRWTTRPVKAGRGVLVKADPCLRRTITSVRCDECATAACVRYGSRVFGDEIRRRT